MHPIRTPETNKTFTLVGGTEENDLPCVIDENSVTSTWRVAPSDLEALSRDYPRLILDVIWPLATDSSCRIGDNSEYKFASSELIDERPEGPMYHRFTKELTPREVAVLDDGATITVSIGMLPPPPISLQLA